MFCRKKNFCRDKNRKKEALTFSNFHEAFEKDNYRGNFLFKPLQELQKIDYNGEKLDELLINSHELWQINKMCFPETISQPMERLAFGNWKSRDVKKALKNAWNCLQNFSTFKMKHIGSSARNNEFIYQNQPACKTCKWKNSLEQQMTRKKRSVQIF